MFALSNKHLLWLASLVLTKNTLVEWTDMPVSNCGSAANIATSPSLDLTGRRSTGQRRCCQMIVPAEGVCLRDPFRSTSKTFKDCGEWSYPLPVQCCRTEGMRLRLVLSFALVMVVITLRSTSCIIVSKTFH